MSDIISQMKASDMVQYIRERVGNKEEDTLKTIVLPYDLKQSVRIFLRFKYVLYDRILSTPWPRTIHCMLFSFS